MCYNNFNCFVPGYEHVSVSVFKEINAKILRTHKCSRHNLTMRREGGGVGNIDVHYLARMVRGSSKDTIGYPDRLRGRINSRHRGSNSSKQAMSVDGAAIKDASFRA